MFTYDNGRGNNIGQRQLHDGYIGQI